MRTCTFLIAICILPACNVGRGAARGTSDPAYEAVREAAKEVAEREREAGVPLAEIMSGLAAAVATAAVVYARKRKA